MVNSRGSNALHHIKTVTLASANATINLTETIDFSNYSKVTIIFNVQATATLAPRIELDGDTGNNYNYDIVAIPGLTENAGAGQSSLLLTSLTTNYDMNGEINLYQAKGLADKAILGHVYISNTPVAYIITAQHAAATTTITQIDFKTSTSTFKTGSFISVYGTRK